MELYKIINQLTEEEFQEIYTNFMANKAEKTAAFLQIIRGNPDSPDKEFLDKFDVTPAAFYVLKSRLNQKIETFLLNRLGDPNLHVMRKVQNVNDLVFNNTREISVAALRKLEKELLIFDFPYGLMIVYKALQNLHAFDENYTYYRSRYNQQVAYALAMDKAQDLVVNFFRSYDNFYLTRKDKDHNAMVRIMEEIDNVNNIKESHRLSIFKYIVHIFARLFIEIPETIRCEVEDSEVMFDKAFEILEEYKEDTFYANLNILFNFLRYVYYDKKEIHDKSKIYFEILDYKIEELLTRNYFNSNTSEFLFHKLNYHRRTGTMDQMISDVENYIQQIEVEPYRLSYYVNYYMFLAHAYFVTGKYKKVTRILYILRNEVNLRKHLHTDLEVKFFLALGYVMVKDFDLANQLILSLQRQLRKTTMHMYEHAKILIKILNLALGGKPRTRRRNLETNITKWKEENVGKYALLHYIDMEETLMRNEELMQEPIGN